MNVLTVPRTIATYEYKALRYPAQLLETKVIATRFSQESAFRLGFERLLGTLDSAAGSVLANKELQDRGRVLTRRVEVLAKATALEAKAQERKEQADATLRAESERAQAKRTQALEEQQAKAKQVLAEKQAAKAAVERKAEARERALDQAITSKTEATIAAERDRLDKQEASIEARVKAKTAAPKAQLSKAVKDAQTAAATRADADQLALLAAAERDRRRA